MANEARKTVGVDTSSTTGANLGAVDSTTLAVTVALNPNRCLVLCYGTGSTGKGIASATYGGKSFTLGKSSTESDGCHGQVWYCINPPVGTANIEITFSVTTSDRDMIGATCLYNVDLVDPVDVTDDTTATGTSITSTFTATENNCVAVDCFGTNSTSAGSASAGQTEIFKRSAARSAGCSYETDIDAGSESMAWTGFSAGDSASSAAVVVFQGALPKPKVMFIS